MIAVQILGGLGNQMFQYAFARALSLSRRREVVLDCSEFPGYSLRAFALDRMRIELPVADPGQLAAFRPRLPRPALRVLRRFGLEAVGLSGGTVVREKGLAYRRIREHARRPTLFVGYWQTEKYFAEHRDVLRRDFQVVEPPDEANRALLDAIRGSESVCLHVRRGDYVSDASAAQVHGTCSPGYYRLAVRRLQERLSCPRFFVFSDEPDWCRTNLDLPGDTVFADVNGPETPWRDLRLMSACRHFVVANSSFSWWGAWLSDNPGKSVIAPTRWFAAPGKDDRDLVPADWERLQA